LTFDLLDLKFASLVTLIQRYVRTKLEVSMALLLRENRRHGTGVQTGGMQYLMWLPSTLMPNWDHKLRTVLHHSELANPSLAASGEYIDR